MQGILVVLSLCVIVSRSLGCDYYCCYDSFTEELKQEWKECCTPEECEPFKKLEPDSWNRTKYLSRGEKLPVPCNFACCLTPTAGSLLGSNGLNCCNDAKCQFWKTLPPFASSSLSLRSMEESQRRTKLLEAERQSIDSNRRGSRAIGYITGFILGGTMAIFLRALGRFIVKKINRMSAASKQPGITLTGTYQPQTGYGGNNHARVSVPTMATAPRVKNYKDADLPPSYEEV